MTLKRYLDKQKDDPFAVTGYENCRRVNMIFPSNMEAELSKHIKELAASYHGLSKAKCRTLTYEYAVRYGVEAPEKWVVTTKAGEGFWTGFKKRNNFAVRRPEATSLARATAFNRHTVGQFFNNLQNVMDQHNFQAQMVYNADETGCTTVQKPGRIVAEKGIKQIGSVTSCERGEFVTIINAINASGTALPPMLIFPRVNYLERFIRGAPVGSNGAATRSGWVNEKTFVQYLDHFIHHTGCTVDRKVLLILDNRKAHVSLAAVDKAQANGIVLLTIPPYTSHKLQPLDVTVYGPYKKAYARAMDAWMCFNP